MSPLKALLKHPAEKTQPVGHYHFIIPTVFVVDLILQKMMKTSILNLSVCWRDHFLFVAEAIYKSQAETGEIKGHYLNATAGR
jgi:hypothetical protein